MMSNPAFLVEGLMEKRIIQNLCPGKVIRVLNCNGENVSISAIAKRIVSLVRILKGRNYPFIVIFDREKRRESVLEIEKLLTKEIKSFGCNEDIILGIPDRMVENWILADWHNFTIKCPNLKKEGLNCYEGAYGKSKMKSFLLKQDIIYHETIHGVEFFLASNPETIKKHSFSFGRFADAIKNIECFWLGN
ncbi:DUF4276 family protein [Candidatus Pacearchaeota archaeon]|nr:DUF4276 family protein [Candidatus Pacearchaeota archaeon]